MVYIFVKFNTIALTISKCYSIITKDYVRRLVSREEVDRCLTVVLV